MDYSSVPTPERCYADFCLVPVRLHNISPSASSYCCSPSLHYYTSHNDATLTVPSQVGTGELSVAKEVAEVQKLLKASGLTYTMHSAGTTVEGSWDEVMRVIGQAHSVVHKVGPQRIQTSMRVGTRSVFWMLVEGCGLLES
jgi:uncharacterized protein (TIGR00106 family)